jgi:hypothetical protein
VEESLLTRYSQSFAQMSLPGSYWGHRLVFSGITLKVFTGKRRKWLRDKPNVDRVIMGLENIEEEVELHSVVKFDDPNVADANPLPPIFDRELHSWARNP